MADTSSQAKNLSTQVLVVEDDDLKFRDVNLLLNKVLSNGEIWRRENVVEGEEEVQSMPYDLIVLDISMDITRKSNTRARGGHANLGGMDIIERMYLLEITTPIIILTGFDYFRRGGAFSGDDQIINLDDLEKRAKSFLGGALLGCIRYGSEGWQNKFVECLKRGGFRCES